MSVGNLNDVVDDMARNTRDDGQLRTDPHFGYSESNIHRHQNPICLTTRTTPGSSLYRYKLLVSTALTVFATTIYATDVNLISASTTCFN